MNNSKKDKDTSGSNDSLFIYLLSKNISRKNVILLSSIITFILFFSSGVVLTYALYNLSTSISVPLSSTSGLAIPFGIIYSLIVATGAGIGMTLVSTIVTYFINPNNNKRNLKTIKIFIGILLGFIVVFLGYKYHAYVLNSSERNIRYEEKNTIGVKYDLISSGEITNDDISYHILGKLQKEKINYFDSPFNNIAQSFEWNNKQIKIEFNGEIKVFENNKNIIQYQGNEYYPYMSSLSYTIFKSPSKKAYLCFFSNLRATSHLSLLLIFDQDGNKVYEMLINRPS